MGFEEALSNRGTTPAWGFVQHAGEPSFEIAVDDTIAHEGKQSLRLKRTGKQHYALASQIILADRYRGKRVRFSGYLRLADVHAFGPGKLGEISGTGLLLRVSLPGSDLFFDDMRDRPMRGTHEWTRVSIEVDVPPDAYMIEFGAHLSGSGAVWFDGAELTVLPPAVSSASTRQ